MNLSIFKGPTPNFINLYFEESAYRSILNVENVETGVESSTWRFTEPGRSSVVSQSSVSMEKNTSQYPFCSMIL